MRKDSSLGETVGILFKLQALSFTKDQTGYQASNCLDFMKTVRQITPRKSVRLRGTGLCLRLPRLRKARLTLRDQLSSETRLTESRAWECRGTQQRDK